MWRGGLTSLPSPAEEEKSLVSFLRSPLSEMGFALAQGEGEPPPSLTERKKEGRHNIITK